MECRLTTDQKFKSIAGFTENSAEYWECFGVLFCATRKGSAICLHVACKKENIDNLRKGCHAFINHMLLMYDWCKMLIATVSKQNKTVYNLCKNLGFKDLGLFEFELGDANIMVINR